MSKIPHYKSLRVLQPEEENGKSPLNPNTGNIKQNLFFPVQSWGGGRVPGSLLSDSMMTQVAGILLLSLFLFPLFCFSPPFPPSLLPFFPSLPPTCSSGWLQTQTAISAWSLEVTAVSDHTQLFLLQSSGRSLSSLSPSSDLCLPDGLF